MDAMVKAIRENSLIGATTCSCVNECYSDEEILTELRECKITTSLGAVEWAITIESLFQEQSLNYREGSDADPELEIYNEWQTRLADYNKERFRNHVPKDLIQEY